MINKLYEIFLAHPEVCTDSRKVSENSVFFALKGGNFDGNLYAKKAIEQGASYAVVDNPELEGQDERFVVVDDVLSTLQALASHHREVLGLPVIAISGSNGKTTTKELLGAVLSKKFITQTTDGNLNNHIGVPLTLLKLRKETEIAVVEMGASAKGEIALLCQIAKPNFGLLTNVGRAHLEGFGGEQGVRQAKGELYDYLQEHQGQAFYRVEDKVISSMISERKSLESLAYSSLGDLPQSNLEGDYNRFNVAAAVAVARFFKVKENDICDAISSYLPTNNRSQRLKTERNSLIVDCYNANPSSMQSALDNFKTIETEQPKIAILGDMFELGEYADQEHRRVLMHLEDCGVERVIVVGENFAKAASLYQGRNYRLSFFADTQSVSCCKNISGALVILKGSRGVGLEVLIDKL